MKINYAAHLELTNPKSPSLDAALGLRALRHIRDALPSDKQAPILEIGPGHCAFLKALLDDGYRNCQAIEADESLAERAGSGRLPVRHCPAEETIPWLLSNPGGFSAIYCAHVLEHVPLSEQIAFLSAIRTALKPDGVLICEVPNASSPTGLHHRYWDWTHRTLFTASSLTFALNLGGFAKVTIRPSAPVISAPRGPIMDVIMTGVLRSLAFLSAAIHRVHLVADLGAAGLKIPVTFAIVAIAQ